MPFSSLSQATSPVRPCGTSRITGRSSKLCCRCEAREEPQSRRFFGVQPVVAGLAAVSIGLSACPALAAFRLPPIDSDPRRCERAFSGNSLGMANAVSDKVLDLRKCDYKGANLNGKQLPGALMSESDFTGAQMVEATMTKSYAKGANFSGVDFTNAIVDRVDFRKADLHGAKFNNAVVSGSQFEGANLTDTIFEDVLIGYQDAINLCLNDTLSAEGRTNVGCRANKLMDASDTSEELVVKLAQLWQEFEREVAGQAREHVLLSILKEMKSVEAWIHNKRPSKESDWNPRRAPHLAGDKVENLCDFAPAMLELERSSRTTGRLYSFQHPSGKRWLSDPTGQVENMREWIQERVLDAGSFGAGQASSPHYRTPPLFINGQVKTGKTFWLQEVLPALVAENRRLGIGGDDEVLVLHINAEHCRRSPGASAAQMLHEMLCQMLEWACDHRPTISASAWERAVNAASVDPLRAEKERTFRALKGLLAGIKDPLLVLLDEVQFLLMPGKVGSAHEVDEEGAVFMRNVLLKDLLMTAPMSQIFALTGSSMALLWQSLAKVPRNGFSPLLMHSKVQLPSVFPRPHLKAVRDQLKVPPAFSKLAPPTPACLTAAAVTWLEIAGKRPSAAEHIAQWVAEKLVTEYLEDWGRAMFLLSLAQRLKLLQLASPERGLDAIYRGCLWTALGAGLAAYLGPHCEKTRLGTLYLRSAEARIALQTLINDDGQLNLDWKPELGNSRLLTLGIRRDLHAVGETVYNIANSNHLKQLEAKGITPAGIKQLEEWLQVLATDLNRKSPAASWDSSPWFRRLLRSVNTSEDAKTYQAAREKLADAATVMTANEKLKWVLRFCRHIPSHEGFPAEAFQPDPGDADLPHAMPIEETLPAILKCSMPAFLNRLAQARACMAEVKLQSPGSGLGQQASEVPYRARRFMPFMDGQYALPPPHSAPRPPSAPPHHGLPFRASLSQKQGDKLGIAVYLEASQEKPCRDGVECSDPSEPHAVQLCLERNNIFQWPAAVRTLQQLQIASLSSMKTHPISMATLNMQTEVQKVCAAGALMAILQKQQILLEGPNDLDAQSSGPIVSGVREVALEGFLMIDLASLQALQIFSEEKHPSCMGIGSSKEGFSVYNMLNKCITNMGRRMLRMWMLRPIVDLDAISERQTTIEHFMGRPDVVKEIRTILRLVKDVPRMLQRLQQTQGCPDIKDFKLIMASLTHILQLHSNIQGLATPGMTVHPAEGQSDRRKRRRTSISPAQSPCGIDRLASFQYSQELLTCQSLIADIIDFEQEDDNMMIHYNICSKLDELKISYHGLPSLLTKVVESELQRVPRELRTQLKQNLWSVLYMPQVGFVLRLDGMHLTADLDDYLPDFELAFEGNAESTFGTYYHTDSTRQLNARFGDLKMKIQDLEVAICNSLLSRLQRFSSVLSQATDFAAEVDCLTALAMSARDYHLTRPRLTQQSCLEIKQGRHLLTEAVAGTYIPADTMIGEQSGRIQVVTGPNMSGKSCYAKQIALIVFLAHIGSFVPAESATIGLTDRILTRVPRRDSQRSMQSSFMTDLTQVAAMLKQATSRSLCIIDEFGKGTLNADGIGLLCGTLQHLAAMDQPPVVFACTHFSELFLESCIPRSITVSFKTMQVITDKEPAAGPSQNDIIFLYKPVVGHCLPSYGIHCASLASVPEPILHRAAQVLQLREDGAHIHEIQSECLQHRQSMILALASHLADLDLSSKADLARLMDEAMHISQQGS
ncbi:hypothetical protein WJX74_010463 [Apatococcus lobatus]|uniref:DNA mismatch repair protein MSH5 n=1 Tax=Apatococcus lobatus TaxID=904363 RepID=A0AAW1RY43_9CHLO